MKKKLLIVITLFIIIAIAGYFYVYKDHRNIADEEATFSLTVDKIYTDFSKDEAKATAKYLDKTIVVNGRVTSIDLKSKLVTIDQKLLARFDSDLSKTIKNNQNIKIKGRILGYDSLVEEVQMDQCSLLP
jgi:hypothetical protein